MTDTKMGAKVRALLDKAEASEFPEEASAFRAKAEELMVKYRIDQEQALAVDPSIAKPVSRNITLVHSGSKYKQTYWTMWHHISVHCGVRSWLGWEYTEQGYQVVAHVVGYEEDLSYAEMLYTAARMVFTERLEPKIKPELSDQVNVYRLRAAGIERVRIAELMWGNTDKVFLGRVGRLYKAECEERGEVALLSGRGVTGKAYREQYAEQFVSTLYGRLWQARQAASVTGGGLVLHGRQARIDEAFYDLYPDQRPAPELPAGEETPECPKCARSARGRCKEHYVPMGRSSAGPDYHSVAAERGRMAGAAAAREVAIRREGGQGQIGD